MTWGSTQEPDPPDYTWVMFPLAFVVMFGVILIHCLVH